MKSWGSQLDVADKLERDCPFRASAENESELLDCDDAIFLTSSDAAASAPLHMNEFLEVMDHKNKSKITPSSSEPSFLHKSRCGG